MLHKYIERAKNCTEELKGKITNKHVVTYRPGTEENFFDSHYLQIKLKYV